MSYFNCGKIIIIQTAPKVKELKNKKGFSWTIRKSDHFITYYEIDSYADKYMQSITKRNEENYANVLKILNEKKYIDTMHVFCVDSRKRMKDLLGYETNGSAFPNRNIIVYVYSKNIKANTSHELMHIISWNLWGKPETWISEGLAVFSDKLWRNYHVHKVSHYLYKKEKLIPLEKLFENFDSYNDLISYPEVGSFVKFVYERYGFENFRKIWDKGYKSIPNIIGKDLSKLETEWLNLIKEFPIEDMRYDYNSNK